MRVALIILLAASTASAQPYDDAETEEALKALDDNGQVPTPPTDPGVEPAPPGTPPPQRAPGLALPRGGVVMTLTAEASLSKGASFEPTSIAPDIAYGVADGVTVSLVTSGAATTGFRGGAGFGFCVTGEDKGCLEVFNNAGAEVLVDVVRGPLSLAGLAGVHALSIDPKRIDAKVGAQTAYRAGKLAATFNPSLFVGLNERDAGNKGGVFLPVSIGAQLSPPLFLALGGGVAAPLADVDGGWSFRLGIIGRVRVAKGAFVSASFFFPKLSGGETVMQTGTDVRFANLWFTFVR